MVNLSLHDWVYTAIFGAMSTLVIGNNVFNAVRSLVKSESTSFTLFMGAIFGAIACLAAPVDGWQWLAFIPALIDPGTSWVIYALFKNGLHDKS